MSGPGANKMISTAGMNVGSTDTSTTSGRPEDERVGDDAEELCQVVALGVVVRVDLGDDEGGQGRGGAEDAETGGDLFGGETVEVGELASGKVPLSMTSTSRCRTTPRQCRLSCSSARTALP
ncbi:MAG: hypothetical protein WBG76_07265 [Ornithinimicrobium sp.]